MRSAIVAVAALAALAGCTAPSEPKVATAQPTVITTGPVASEPSPSPSPSSSPPSTKETDYDRAVRYTRCMTDHGTVMSDPVAGKPLQTGDPSKGSGWQRATNAAFDKCKQFLPATWPVTADPVQIARDKPFFACLRQHGIDAGTIDANGMIEYPADPTTEDTPAYRAAEAACRYLVDDPANNQ